MEFVRSVVSLRFVSLCNQKPAGHHQRPLRPSSSPTEPYRIVVNPTQPNQPEHLGHSIAESTKICAGFSFIFFVQKLHLIV